MSRLTPISKAKGRKAVITESSGGGADFLKVEGNTTYDMRIIQGMDDEVFPWVEYFYHEKTIGGHWDLFTIDGRMRKITCPIHQYGETECALCQCNDFLQADGSSEKGLRIKTAYFMNVIVDGEVKIWTAPPSVQKKLAEYWNNPKYGPNTFSLDKGRNFTILKSKGKNQFWEYTVTPDPDRSKVEIPGGEGRCAVLRNLITRYEPSMIRDLALEQLDDVMDVKSALGTKPASTKATPVKKVAKKRATKKKK